MTTFLKNRDFNLDLLTFRDEVNLDSLHSQGRLSITLVDHNVQKQSDSHLEDVVQEIIDHHKLDRKIDETKLVQSKRFLSTYLRMWEVLRQNCETPLLIYFLVTMKIHIK